MMGATEGGRRRRLLHVARTGKGKLWAKFEMVGTAFGREGKERGGSIS